MNEPTGTPDTDDERPLSPEAMLALADDQRRFVTGRIASFVPMILLTWAIAWLIGFLALWLIDGAAPAFSLPLPVAVTIFVVAIVIGIVVSTVLGIRSSRGLRGNPRDAFAGAVYGSTWTVGSIAIVVFAQGLVVNGMDPDLANIFYPVAFVLFTGLMYLLGAAIWHAVPMLILGLWLVVVAAVAPFFGYPGHYLWLALAGGLGLLALAIASFAYLGRMRARLAEAVHRG